MRFHQWLIAEEARQVIMFHGTGMASWPAIRSNGLDPNPDRKTWAEDPDASFNQPSRASYGGIYLTQNIITATGSAWRTNKKTGGGKLLLAVAVDPRTLVADEDSVTFSVSRVPIPGLLTTDYSASDLYLSLKIISDPEYRDYAGAAQVARTQEYIQKARDQFVADAISSLTYKLKDKDNKALLRALTGVLNQGFEASLTRLVAHADQHSREYAARNYDQFGAKVKWPSKSEGELVYRDFVDRLTFIMRKLADPEHNKSITHSARSMRPIGFEGRNRIVYAAEIMDVPYKTYDDRTSTREACRPLYGEPPPELIAQWEQRQGEWTWLDEDGKEVNRGS